MKLLIICRDNIGDSILATPLIRALSPLTDNGVDVLTNSYASPVFHRNPDIHTVWEYSKSKHCKNLWRSALAGLLRVKTILKMRTAEYDAVIIAKSNWDRHSLKWAGLLKAKQVIAYGDSDNALINTLLPLPPKEMHTAEILFRLCAVFNGTPALPGKTAVYPDPVMADAFRAALSVGKSECCIALQISARKVNQQWSATKFIALAHEIAERMHCRILLLWSPGEKDNAMHPGDDIKAEYIASAFKGKGLTPVYTRSLEDLKAVLSLCCMMVSSDGGAVHIAAALDLPVVALYGNSDPVHWHPWQVPHRVLCGKMNNVNNIPVRDVFHSVNELYAESVSKNVVMYY